MDKLKDYLTIKDAASFVGVSAFTLRRWDRAGKLKPRRNPLNKYRLYKKEALESLLRDVNNGSSKLRYR